MKHTEEIKWACQPVVSNANAQSFFSFFFFGEPPRKTNYDTLVENFSVIFFLLAQRMLHRHCKFHVCDVLLVETVLIYLEELFHQVKSCGGSI